MTGDDTPLFFPVPIGVYRDEKWAQLDVDREVGRIAGLLEPFGVEHEHWPSAPAERDATVIEARLRSWNTERPGRASIFYWVGHGAKEGNHLVVLADHGTSHPDRQEELSGTDPERIARLIHFRHTSLDPPAWTVVVIDACSSASFVQNLEKQIADKPTSIRNLVLIGTSGDGETRLGEVSLHLEQTLRIHYGRNDEIPVADLFRQLIIDGLHGAERVERGTLAAATLRRRRAIVPVTGALDLLTEIETAVDSLGEPDRLRFLRPLQGGEAGELSWHFAGRDREQRRITAWLRTAGHGLLAVTGGPGAGKSAVLGQILARSLPPMRQVLARLGFPLADSPDTSPGDDVFTTTLLLTGFDRHTLTAALARAGGLPTPPLHRDPDQLVAWLTASLPPVTVLADALDEAREPEVLARMLARVTRRAGIRVLLGTRNIGGILEELGADAATVPLDYEDATVREYVNNHLSHVFPDLSYRELTGVSARVAESGRDFLFARLAVGEMVRRPDLVGDQDALGAFLAGGSGGAFAVWLDRAGDRNPVLPRLLTALAFARGRGLPSADGVWSAVAGSLATGPAPGTADIDRVVSRDAAGFLIADIENGVTVYRLAHSRYGEVLRDRAGLGEPEAHLRIVRALLRAAASGTGLTPYPRAYLSAHVAAAGRAGWVELAGHPAVLDLVDGERLRADLIHDAVRHSDLPPEILGVIGAGRLIARAAPADRRGLREVATARYAGRARFDGDGTPTGSWSVRHAWLNGEMAHLEADQAGAAMIHGLTAFTGPGGLLLASTGDDDMLRVVDPATGELTARHRWPARRCRALATAPGADGRDLLVTGGEDGIIRFRNPWVGRPVPPPLTGHDGQIRGLSAFRSGRRRLLASGGDDGTVRIWSLDDRRLMATGTGHHGWVMAVTWFADRSGRPRVASAGKDKTVRVWDSLTGEPLHVLSGHTDWVYDVTAFTGRGGEPRLASAGGDGRIRIWDPETGREVREPIRASAPGQRAIHTVAAFTGADGSRLLVSGGDDRVVRIWDPHSPAPAVADSGALHKKGIRAVALLTDRRGEPAVASAGVDRVIRVWNFASQRQSVFANSRFNRSLTAVTAYTVERRGFVAAAGRDRQLRVWETGRDEPPMDVVGTSRSTINSIVPVRGTSRTQLLATAASNGSVSLWDPAARRPVGDGDWRHGGKVLALAGLQSSNGRGYLVSGGHDRTVAFWTVHPSGPRIQARLDGHTGCIRAAAVLPLSGAPVAVATGGDDGIRIWDPYARVQRGPVLATPYRQIAVLFSYRVGARYLLAVGMRNGTIWIMDPALGTRIAVRNRAHRRQVVTLTAIAGPDGLPVLVSGGPDRELRLWNPVTLDPLAGLPVDVAVTGLAAAGGSVAVASSSGLLLIDANPPATTAGDPR